MEMKILCLIRKVSCKRVSIDTKIIILTFVIFITVIRELNIGSEDTISITSSAVYSITITNNKISLKSSLRVDHKDVTIELDQKIAKSCHNNDLLFVLTVDGNVHKLDFFTVKIEKIHNDLGIADISCTFDGHLFALDRQNQLHQILPELKLVTQFPRHQKIRKLISGAEHTLLLTTNGDIFSFGCGLRGALGHGDVNSYEKPKLIEALAGIKINDIAAGSFHSVAVSSFGDIYTWGWNTCGQLGVGSSTSKLSLKQKVKNHQQVFTIPQLVEIDDELEPILSVHCGCKHTIARTENHRLFVAGSNRMGQLGLSRDVDEVGRFTEAPISGINKDTKISTGYWSTFFY